MLSHTGQNRLSTLGHLLSMILKNNKEKPPTVQITDFLPTTQAEMLKHGWDNLDVIIVSGDAYVDHPSFGHAVVARMIERAGFKVGIIAQPNWQDDLRDFKKFGRPSLFFGVTAGCMDSMINHYTGNKRRRSDDAYTAGGQSGFRPDYAVSVYTRILKSLYPETPVIIGGIEASLRRVTHYDYWQNKLRPSILIESGADLLVYGMGEQPLTEILNLLGKNVPFANLTTVRQTAYLQPVDLELVKVKKWQTRPLNAHDACLQDKAHYAANFCTMETESNRFQSENRLTQTYQGQTLVINPPFPPMLPAQIDQSFALNYTRLPHPKYKKRGTIPAYEMIKFSITTHRGCFGGCSFCTISAHQGKFITSRSQASILQEVGQVTKMPGFKGYISDLGGPSANMYSLVGIKKEICQACTKYACIYPKVCGNLNTDHTPMVTLLKKATMHPLIKKVFIASGVRYDMLLQAKTKYRSSHEAYLTNLIENHTSGRLKVAPEHTNDAVLKLMRKPAFALFALFVKSFHRINDRFKLKQELIPYFISSHPGCGQQEMAELAVETAALGYKLEQIQDFTPTPMTLSAVMYYTGFDPYTLQPVAITTSPAERTIQRRFFFWYKKENWHWFQAKLKQFGLRLKT